MQMTGRTATHASLALIIATCALLATNALWIAPACAALGGDAASAAADEAEMHGIATSAPRQQYDLLEITNDSGMRLREYLDRSGNVFAVSWSGPVLPDLQRLLGAHYAQYAAAIASLEHPGLHRSVRVSTPELVAESTGHLRAYAGRAYLPALVPAGVLAAELR